MLNKLRGAVFQDPPCFHFWKGAPQPGGFSKPFFEFMERCLVAELPEDGSSERRLLETGAGLSTLFFISLGFRVTSFSLPDVIEKMEEYLVAENLSAIRPHWRPYSGRSELLLPTHVVETTPTYDACLIDGSHSVHSVFVDFMYCHETLKTGGVIFVDDTHFPGPSLLAQLLDQLDNYEACGQYQKLRAFRKTSGRKMYDNMVDFSFRHPVGREAACARNT
jgi:hypothetical protein